MTKVKDVKAKRDGSRRKRLVRGALIGAMGCCLLTLAFAFLQTSDPTYQATRTAVAALETARYTPEPSATASEIPPSATITDTPEPSATPSLEARARPLIEEALQREASMVRLLGDGGAESLLAIEFRMVESFEGFDEAYAGYEIARIICGLRAGGLGDYTLQINAALPTLDAGGRAVDSEGVVVMITPERAAGIDCEALLDVDIALEADEYRVNALLRSGVVVDGRMMEVTRTATAAPTLVNIAPFAAPAATPLRSPFTCNGIDDLNCGDFNARGLDARGHLAQCGDEDDLDRDGDGMACEVR